LGGRFDDAADVPAGSKPWQLLNAKRVTPNPVTIKTKVTIFLFILVRPLGVYIQRLRIGYLSSKLETVVCYAAGAKASFSINGKYN
jgi:hypothetical protein